jgi:hypothetical protein
MMRTWLGSTLALTLGAVAACSHGPGLGPPDGGDDEAGVDATVDATEPIDAAPMPTHDATIDAEAGVDAGPDADSSVPTCEGCCYLGDVLAPIQMEISTLNAANEETTPHDGDRVSLLAPPQLGRVIYVGVRATNLANCGATISAALRDTSSQLVRLDSRTVNLNARADGWATSGTPTGGASNTANYANVPACPNQWSARDIYGQPYQLEVTITDRNQKTATRTITVVPQCDGVDRPSEPCACVCAHGYVLGQPCGDAGSAADASRD